MITAILLIILWLALALISLACTLGPVAIIVGALVLLGAAIGGRR